MNTFSQLPAVKNDSKNGAARKIFGPSYFVTALIEYFHPKFLVKNLSGLTKGHIISKFLFGVFNLFQNMNKTPPILVKTESFVHFMKEFKA